MSDTKALEVKQLVAAPIERVFAFLADPRQHVVIDGSGTVQGARSGPITEVGQSFVMDMHRDDLGHYRSVNTVTEFEPGTSVGWAPSLDRSYECDVVEKLAEITTGGHTYTYRLREVDGGTEVTEIYDWSGVEDPRFAAFCPFVSRDDLTGTLANLARAVEGASYNTAMQKATLAEVTSDVHGLISKRTAALDGVDVTEVTFGRGARWSNDLKEYAGTELCELPHVAIVNAGALGVQMADGTEEVFRAGDVMLLPPGHDAWTVGNESCTFVEFSRGNDYYT